MFLCLPAYLDFLTFKFSGWGVIAMKSFEKGSFLLKYIGETVSREDGENREKEYEKKKLGCYLYFFSYKGEELW